MTLGVSVHTADGAMDNTRRQRQGTMSKTKDHLTQLHGDDFDDYWDSFDCEIQCDEDPALAAYEAMLEAGICDNSDATDTTQPKYIPDPTDDIPW